MTPTERESLRAELAALPHYQLVNYALAHFEIASHHQNEALRLKVQLRDTVEKCRYCDGTGLVYDPVGDRPCAECRGSGRKQR